jgi:hypothetical protein
MLVNYFFNPPPVSYVKLFEGARLTDRWGRLFPVRSHHAICSVTLTELNYKLGAYLPKRSGHQDSAS